MQEHRLSFLLLCNGIYMTKKLIAIVLLYTFSVFSFASNHLIFSCLTNDGKEIEVKRVGQYIQYSYGFSGKPELVFENLKKEVVKQTQEIPLYSPHLQWIVLKNGEYMFMPSIYIGHYNNNDETDITADVSIYRGIQNVSNIFCDKKKKDFYVNFYEIYSLIK